MHNFLRFFTLLMALSLIGCGATLPKIKPYKMDIQQGNVVTSEMLLKLRPGMTKSQVKFIMGTPLLVDSFRTNRWDYFYQLRKQGKIVNQRRVILDFEDDLLKRVRGDVVAKGKTAEDVARELEQEAKEQQEVESLKDESDGSSGAEVQPMEAPAIEATENLPESAEPAAMMGEDGEPVSALVEAVEPPEARQALEENAEQLEVVQEGANKMDKAMPAVEAQPEKASITEKVPEPAAVPIIEPGAEPKSEVLTVMPSKVDGKLIFRMDRSLNTNRIVPQEVSTSEVALQPSVVQEVKDVEAALPEEEPSFFERMLEKIGF